MSGDYDDDEDSLGSEGYDDNRQYNNNDNDIHLNPMPVQVPEPNFREYIMDNLNANMVAPINNRPGGRNPVYKARLGSLDNVKEQYGKVFSLIDLYNFVNAQRTDLLDQFQQCNLNLVLANGDDSLLAVAAFNGSLNCLQYLIDVGVDLDYQASDGVTALMSCVYAAWNDRMAETIQRLILAGANVNITEKKYGFNVIQLAYARHNINVLKTLMNLGIDISNVLINGLSPIEYILTQVTDTSMDEILTTLIENSIDTLFTRIPRLLHFLARKSTPYLEQLLRKNCPDKNKVADNNDTVDKDKNDVTDKKNDIDITLIDSFNYDLIFSNYLDQYYSEETTSLQSKPNNNNNDINILLERDGNGMTPLHYAVDANLIDNVKLLLEYGSGNGKGNIDLNSPMYRSLFDQIITQNKFYIMELFIDYGVRFDPTRQWIHWYFSNYVNNINRNVIEIILKHTKHIPIFNKTVSRPFKNCNCSIFDLALLNVIPDIIERIIIDQPKHFRYNHDTRCKSSNCNHNQQSGVQYFLDRLGSRRLQSFDKTDVFTTMYLLLKYNYATESIISEISWNHLSDNNIATLFEHFGVLNFGKIFDNYPLNHHHRDLRKWLVCHSKTMHFTPRNTEEYGTDEPIDDIPSEDFVLLDNDIVWSLDNLYQYLFSTVKGVNEYDRSSPWKGEQIISPDDLQRLSNSDHPMAVKIYNYMSVTQYLKHLPLELIDQLADIGSIFSAKGAHFENTLAKIVTPDEAVEWSDVRNFESTNAMPKLSHNLSTKISDLKQHTMEIDLLSIYTKLTNEQKDCLYSLNSELSNVNFKKLFEGTYCIMTLGAHLTNVKKALTKWK